MTISDRWLASVDDMDQDVYRYTISVHERRFHRDAARDYGSGCGRRYFEFHAPVIVRVLGYRSDPARRGLFAQDAKVIAVLVKQDSQE